MAYQVESPPSSPPGSTIKVRTNTPPDHADHARDHRESATESITDAMAKTATGRQTASPGRADTSEKNEIAATIADDDAPDKENQSTAPKRKGRPGASSAPAKKPRRVPVVPKKALRKKAAPRKSARDKRWDAPFVLTDSRSPLAMADLRAILLLPEAWDVLTQEEKQEILAKFPDDTHILDAGTPDARPNLVSLRNDDNFRHDCARYCENLEAGRYDDEWLRQAWPAHEKHRRGDFDGFLRDEFEAEWGIELPGNSEPEEPGPSQGPENGAVEPSEPLESNPATTRQGTPTPTRSPPQSTRSRQTPTRGSPPSQAPREKPRKAAARQPPRRRPAMVKPKTRQSTRSPSVRPRSPSKISPDQAGDSIVVSQPTMTPVSAVEEGELERPPATSLKRKARGKR
ncbi:hypothetical protein BT67DRAFT_438878 [Trichocladium antarcticum]|uniref:DEUBAD domain-containing protein n=1 Tax=Trichocladium antarcticum TaxID=1450529 RepID=A0AAN6US06_9PEZI|nr:hypothetical protein BT67DRAFT_438878 [Trichocladium antarcticum]